MIYKPTCHFILCGSLCLSCCYFMRLKNKAFQSELGACWYNLNAASSESSAANCRTDFSLVGLCISFFCQFQIKTNLQILMWLSFWILVLLECMKVLCINCVLQNILTSHRELILLLRNLMSWCITQFRRRHYKQHFSSFAFRGYLHATCSQH